MADVDTPKTKTQKVKDDRYIIVLERNDDIPPTGLPVSVNGYAYLIPPGKEVTVPRSVVEVLDHAEKLMPEVDPANQQIVGYRPQKRYPYRVISAPNEAGDDAGRVASGAS